MAQYIKSTLLNDYHKNLTINKGEITNTTYIIANDVAANNKQGKDIKININDIKPDFKKLSYVTHSELNNASYVTHSELNNASYVTHSELNNASYVTHSEFNSTAITGVERTSDGQMTQWATDQYNLIYCNLRTKSNKSIRLYVPPVNLSVGDWKWNGSGLMIQSDKNKLDEYPSYTDLNKRISYAYNGVTHFYNYGTELTINNLYNAVNTKLTENSSSSYIISTLNLRFSYTTDMLDSSKFKSALYRFAVKPGFPIYDRATNNFVYVENYTSTVKDDSNNTTVFDHYILTEYKTNMSGAGTNASFTPMMYKLALSYNMSTKQFSVTQKDIIYMTNPPAPNMFSIGGNEWVTPVLQENTTDRPDVIEGTAFVGIRIDETIFEDLKHISTFSIKIKNGINELYSNREPINVQLNDENGTLVSTSRNNIIQEDYEDKMATFYFDDIIDVNSLGSYFTLNFYKYGNSSDAPEYAYLALDLWNNENWANISNEFLTFTASRGYEAMPKMGFNMHDVVQLDLDNRLRNVLVFG